jgi:EAL domain-containing protein (putative c-di-GMP-specific phosphodiesterase class I)
MEQAVGGSEPKPRLRREAKGMIVLSYTVDAALLLVFLTGSIPAKFAVALLAAGMLVRGVLLDLFGHLLRAAFRSPLPLLKGATRFAKQRDASLERPQVHICASTWSRERSSLEADLAHALSSSQLQLHYQLKLDIATGTPRGTEASLHWQHPNYRKLLSADLMRIAEDCGLILPLGARVINEVCRQASVWQRQGISPVRIAVDVSATQFRQPDFAQQLREALQSNSLEPSCLELELTEATLMSNAEKSVSMLEQLSRLGVSIAIDAFGTSYSSMTYLQRFPVNKLKIDHSFIRHLDSNPGNASIVRAIISLAHGLRLEVVAQGVESRAQLDLLRLMGCDQYQGPLEGPALAAADMRRLLIGTSTGLHANTSTSLHANTSTGLHANTGTGLRANNVIRLVRR